MPCPKCKAKQRDDFYEERRAMQYVRIPNLVKVEEDRQGLVLHFNNGIRDWITKSRVKVYKGKYYVRRYILEERQEQLWP